MNEQLVVKNFGPIKGATVDFKRVTVFIGPTGGGKSTLAKLAAVFRDDDGWMSEHNPENEKDDFEELLNKYLILDYRKADGNALWQADRDIVIYGINGLEHDDSKHKEIFKAGSDAFERIAARGGIVDEFSIFSHATEKERRAMTGMYRRPLSVYYIPADRAFASALDSGLAGLALAGIALPKALLSFLNEFKLAQNNLQMFPLDVPFLKLRYRMVDKQPRVELLGPNEVIELEKGASGIQSIIPMMLIINNAIKRRSKQVVPYSFIIEEPELNLYPTAQQGLLNWLVEKCTKGENDLTITTHSPYILSHLNLLLYAYQVGNKDEEKRAKVKAIIPEEYWINPDEFAAYYVNGPEGENGVRSLVDAETKLISRNGLDTISGIQADQFDQLLDINSGF
ncbi:AAA family ATPase [Hymenobacter sp. M29]|uniref:AAA family ATPase n=1 Tax=Hymenobacter mellowenesis TaxID=3063995 RepID=A0ABT9AEL8_9BACT|nr:AAA family ATPase [Hymenobacter sp. M29]MDO7847819.1 AAA family ATPase [Hymenobacter sp. M29]